jgi:hypothetical protein
VSQPGLKFDTPSCSDVPPLFSDEFVEFVCDFGVFEKLDSVLPKSALSNRTAAGLLRRRGSLIRLQSPKFSSGSKSKVSPKASSIREESSPQLERSACSGSLLRASLEKAMRERFAYVSTLYCAIVSLYRWRASECLSLCLSVRVGIVVSTWDMYQNLQFPG